MASPDMSYDKPRRQKTWKTHYRIVARLRPGHVDNYGIKNFTPVGDGWYFWNNSVLTTPETRSFNTGYAERTFESYEFSTIAVLGDGHGGY